MKAESAAVAKVRLAQKDEHHPPICPTCGCSTTHASHAITPEEYEVLREHLTKTTYERGYLDGASRGLAAQVPAEERLRAAAQEVWDSVPASYDEDDPVVQRHARALNELGAVLRALGSER